MLRNLAIIVVLTIAAAAQTAYQPKFPGDPAHSDPEAAALGYMRTVANAQREYKKKFGHYAASLYALAGGARSFTKRMARTDRGLPPPARPAPPCQPAGRDEKVRPWRYFIQSEGSKADRPVDFVAPSG